MKNLYRLPFRYIQLTVLVGGAFTLFLPRSDAANSPWTKAELLERQPRPGDLLPYPADRQRVGINPPAFLWTPNEKAKRYRLEVGRTNPSSQPLLYSEPVKSTVYPPYQKLAPGEYVWQVVYLDESGAPAGVSKLRRFTLPQGVPELLMPDIGVLKAQFGIVPGIVPGVRPRLFLNDQRLTQLRNSVRQGTAPSWERLRKAADAALAEQSYPEPQPDPTSPEWDSQGRFTYLPAKLASAHLARAALAYQITGDPKYLADARRWLLVLASWDPKGITSHLLKIPDGLGRSEASMPMLERMSLGWDWIGDKLTPDERRKVLTSMTERGNQVLRTLESQDFLSHPISNHSGRVIAFLGEAGLAFLGDIPEAEKWLDYALRAYLTSSPSFGGDEGGWAQGMSYWSFYIYCHANFGEALRIATGTDLFKKPFFRNTGHFGLYFLPPYAPRGGFGDGGYHRPGESASVLADTLADEYGDPVLKWYAKGLANIGEKNETKWREWFVEDLYETLREAGPSTLQPKSPDKLDGSRYFPDVGWVAMHSALGDAKRDVWAMFKASRFGSFSHSHADQNTFQLYAYGRSLAIDSGYHPAQGSPHDSLYTRQTRAHNGILVNGRGQSSTQWEAAGRIEDYQRRGIITLVRGEAADAYNQPQSKATLLQWAKYLKDAVPPMDPRVESYQRTLAFVGSQARPVLVVHDYVRTSAATRFDWLFHAVNEMRTDGRTGEFTVEDGEARLSVRLASTVPYGISQTDRFPIAPEEPATTAYILTKDIFANQWHLKAATANPVREVKFLAVMVPYRASEPPPQILPIGGTNSTGFRVAGTEIAAWWGDGVRGNISADNLKGEGRFVIKVVEGGHISTMLSQ